jgi:hypothetical protein
MLNEKVEFPFTVIVDGKFIFNLSLEPNDIDVEKVLEVLERFFIVKLKVFDCMPLPKINDEG